ncbi:hypothetical protein Lser_V15G11281 [Lactuca serriola]
MGDDFAVMVVQQCGFWNLFVSKSNGFKQLNIHAWEAFEKGNDVHMQSAPSQAELLYKNYKVNKEKLKSQVKEKLNMIVLEESSKTRKSIASKKDPESSKKHEDIKQPSLLPLQEKLSGIWFS